MLGSVLLPLEGYVRFLFSNIPVLYRLVPGTSFPFITCQLIKHTFDNKMPLLRIFDMNFYCVDVYDVLDEENGERQ